MELKWHTPESVLLANLNILISKNKEKIMKRDSCRGCNKILIKSILPCSCVDLNFKVGKEVYHYKIPLDEKLGGDTRVMG